MRAILDLVVVTATAAGLLWGCGLLLSRLLVPWRWRPFLPLIAPFLGFGLISALGHYLSASGYPLRSGLWLFVGLAAAGWITVLRDRRLRRVPREVKAALGICLLASLIAAAPLFLLGYLTTLGATIDGISYAVRSEYLQDSTLRLPDVEAGKPYLGWVRAQIGLIRAGDVMLVGVLGLLTGRRSYELLSVVPALFFALTAGSVFLWARVSLRLGRAGALLAAALAGLSNLLLWPAYDNFLSQTIALGFMPLVLCVGVEAQRRPGWRTAALFGLLLSALVSVYPVYALYALAAILGCWGVVWLRRPGEPRGRALGRAALWWLAAFAAAVAWNGVALFRAGSELGFVSHLLAPEGAKYVGRGNILVFPPVIEALGLIAHVSAATYGGAPWPRVPFPILMALGLVFFGLAAYGWWRLERGARLTTGTVLLVSVALAAQQRWGVNLPHGYPYGWFKAVSAMTPQILALVAAGIVAVWRSPSRRRRGLAAAAALLLLVVNAKHTLWTVSYVTKNRLVVDKELIDAAAAASRLKPNAWVLLDLSPGLRQHWFGVLMRDQSIRYRERLFASHVETPGAAKAFFRYALVEKDLDAQRQDTLSEPWYNPGSYSRLWGNRRYELRARNDSTLADLRLETPWPEAAVLEIGLDRGNGVLTARLDQEVREAGLGPDTPRTVQVHLFSLSDNGRVSVAGSEGTVPLSAGGWLLDLDLGCLGKESLAVGHTGEAVLSDVQVLGTATGKRGACVETSRLPVGAVYLEQAAPAEERVRFEAVLLRPDNAGERLYRLGLHVIDPVQQKLFGVWSLDFPPGDRLQRGVLEIDLGDRSSRGEVEGRPISPVTGSFDIGTGSFEGDAVWWQLSPAEQLQMEPMLWFRRTGDGTVTVTKAVPTARLQILAPP